MASRTPLRSLQTLSGTQRRCCQCDSMRILVRSQRQFSTTPLRPEEQKERPRWSFTPPQMKAPFQPRPKDPSKAWTCNEDPAKVDSMYIGLFGRGGDKVLSDEIKWLAITHKSFDQGRRGFNDRLAFFGTRYLRFEFSVITDQNRETNPHSPNFSRPSQCTLYRGIYHFRYRLSTTLRTPCTHWPAKRLSSSGQRHPDKGELEQSR
jgi:hypothetical protein